MFKPPILILVNGNEVQLGGRLPTSITSLSIYLTPGISIPSTQKAQVRQWIQTMISSLNCEYIMVNDTIIYRDK